MRWLPSAANRILVVLLLFVIVLMTGMGYTDRFLGACGLNGLSRSNTDYLDASFDRSLRLFGVLSTIKVGLAIIEGSEVGVGFGLEVGDLAQAAYDHVDVAWRTVLISGVILKSSHYLLGSAAFLDQWFLFIALCFVTLMLIFRWFLPKRVRLRRLARDGSLFVTVLTVALYLTLPLSIAGGRVLSQKITEPSLDQAESGIAKFEKQLSDIQQKQGDDGFFSGLSNLKQKLEEVGTLIQRKTKDLVVYLFTIMAIYLFDCIVFPLFLFLFLLWSTQLIGRYIFGIKKTQNFKEDLEEVIRKANARLPV